MRSVTQNNNICQWFPSVRVHVICKRGYKGTIQNQRCGVCWQHWILGMWCYARPSPSLCVWSGGRPAVSCVCCRCVLGSIIGLANAAFSAAFSANTTKQWGQVQKTCCQLEETALSNEKCGFSPSSVASCCLLLSIQEEHEFCRGHLLLSHAFA